MASVLARNIIQIPEDKRNSEAGESSIASNYYSGMTTQCTK